MPKRRTISERVQFMSADEAAVALGMNARALKRRIQAGAVSPPAKYAEDHRYLFTTDEVERIRMELGLPLPLSAVDQAKAIANHLIQGSNFTGGTARMAEVAGIQREITRMESLHRHFGAADTALQRQVVGTHALIESANRVARITSPAWAFDSYLQEQARVARRLTELSPLESAEQALRAVEDAVVADHRVEANVAPGQVRALDDNESAAEPVSVLHELLTEARETNRLLRALLKAQGAAR